MKLKNNVEIIIKLEAVMIHNLSFILYLLII